MQTDSELSPEEAVALVAASVRSLFTFVSEQQACEVASAVLRELRSRGARLVRDAAPRADARPPE
jgi:hypothetical protein